jgi:hypothetical protein
LEEREVEEEEEEEAAIWWVWNHGAFPLFFCSGARGGEVGVLSKLGLTIAPIGGFPHRSVRHTITPARCTTKRILSTRVLVLVVVLVPALLFSIEKVT